MPWLRSLARLLLLLTCKLTLGGAQDLADPECTIYVRQHEHIHLVQERRRPSNSSGIQQAAPKSRPGFWTAAVAPSPEGITVVWQEADSIFLRRFGHDCRSRGYPCVVSSTRNFVPPPRRHRTSGRLFEDLIPPPGAAASKAAAPTTTTVSPSESPNIDSRLTLRDATALSDGRTAVVWTRDNDVWVSIVSDEAGPPVRASGDKRFERDDVTLTPTPHGKGFLVAWSSFGQDGDGWGIVARVFDNEGKPNGEEHLVNVGWQGSQRRPQLIACVSGSAGPAVWALWGNGTSNTSHELFIRRLAGSASWAPDEELRIASTLPDSGTNSSVLSSFALMCATGSSTEDPTALWAVGGTGTDRRVRWRTVLEAQRGIESHANHSVLVRGPPVRQFLKGNRSRSAAQASRNFSSNSQSQSGGVGGNLLLRAEGDVLAAALEDGHGGVSVQLFDMMPTSPYPSHQMMTVGSALQQVAYDVTADQALITCWTHFSGLSCERRHLQALMEEESEPMALWFAVVIFVVLFWCRHELMMQGGSSRQVQPMRSSPASFALRDLRTRAYWERNVDVFNTPSVPRSMWRLHQQSKYI